MSSPQDPRQFEQRQRYVARIEAIAERLRADERRLRAEIQGIFADWLAPEAAVGKPVCARPLIARHGKLARTLAAIEGRIAAAGDELAVAARELKQHELADLQHTGSAGWSGRPVACPRRAWSAATPDTGPERED